LEVLVAFSFPDADPATYFGFKDLHGFKDFVGFVILCAPDEFPSDDWLNPAEQMNLERAIIGLRYGLDVTASEKGDNDIVNKCRRLVEESSAEYQAGREVEGQKKLEEMAKLLNMLPSR
jgi:hypothetical protein